MTYSSDIAKTLAQWLENMASRKVTVSTKPVAFEMVASGLRTLSVFRATLMPQGGDKMVCLLKYYVIIIKCEKNGNWECVSFTIRRDSH